MATPLEQLQELLTSPKVVAWAEGVQGRMAHPLEAIAQASQEFTKQPVDELTSSLISGGVGSIRRPLRDNFIRMLQDEVPILHREISAGKLLDMTGGGSPFGAPREHYAELPEMALGQGSNRGIRYSISTEGIRGKTNLDKPLLDKAYEQGAGEFLVDAQPSDILKRMKSLEITEEAYTGLSKVERRRIDNLLSHLEQQGVKVSKVKKYSR